MKCQLCGGAGCNFCAPTLAMKLEVKRYEESAYKFLKGLGMVSIQQGLVGIVALAMHHAVKEYSQSLDRKPAELFEESRFDYVEFEK